MRAAGVIKDGEGLLHPTFYLLHALREWIRDYMTDVERGRVSWNIRSKALAW